MTAPRPSDEAAPHGVSHTGKRTRRGRRPAAAVPEDSGTLDALRNRPFLFLWLAQLATQVGGNMVLYGLTLVINSAARSYIAISALMLCFLVPAVVFSAIAGVYVDQLDRRLVLIVTNVLRGVAFVAVAFAGNNLALVYPLIFFVSIVTTFFGPAEASMLPILLPRHQLLAANGIYTLTTNAAFAAGFALFGPFMVSLTSPTILIFAVAALYFVASGLCWTLPPAPPSEDMAPVTAGGAVADAERAVEALIGQLSEGVDYIRKNPNIAWSLTYLGVAASLIGVLGVLGPGFATTTLGLGDKDFIVIVLPLGLGIVTGIMALNSYGKYLPRRRLIEGGLIALGVLLVALSLCGPLSRFLEGNVGTRVQDLGRVVSVLGIVITIGFLAGVAYIFVAVPSQTQLQEDLPEEVRGRIFGILNMLVSIASFLPIILVAPLADAISSPPIIFATGLLIGISGVASIMTRGALGAVERATRSTGATAPSPVDPISAAYGGSEIAAVHVHPRRSGIADVATPSHPTGEPVAAGRTDPDAVPADPPAAAEPADAAQAQAVAEPSVAPEPPVVGAAPTKANEPASQPTPGADEDPAPRGVVPVVTPVLRQDETLGLVAEPAAPTIPVEVPRSTAEGPREVGLAGTMLGAEGPVDATAQDSREPPQGVVGRAPVEQMQAGRTQDDQTPGEQAPVQRHSEPDPPLAGPPAQHRRGSFTWRRPHRGDRPRGVIRAHGRAEPVADRRGIGDQVRGIGRALRRALHLGDGEG